MIVVEYEYTMYSLKITMSEWQAVQTSCPSIMSDLYNLDTCIHSVSYNEWLTEVEVMVAIRAYPSPQLVAEAVANYINNLLQ